MKNHLKTISLVFAATIALTTSASAYCYKGTGSANYYPGSNFSKSHATHIAVKKWESQAKASLHTSAVYWSSAKNKSIKNGKRGGRLYIYARATFCVGQAKRPHRKGKCHKSDIACKVNNMVFKIRPSVIPRGVRVGLNPQPEPPSRRFKRKLQMR